MQSKRRFSEKGDAYDSQTDEQQIVSWYPARQELCGRQTTLTPRQQAGAEPERLFPLSWRVDFVKLLIVQCDERFFVSQERASLICVECSRSAL